MRRTFLITLFSLIACCGAARGAGSEEEIRKAEKSWAAAVAAQDYKTLDRLLGDQLIYAHSTGVVESKSEYLGKMKAGTQKYDSIEHESITIKPYGDTVVAHSNVRMRGTSQGTPFDNRLMMMHVWVKQGGVWRLAAHQTTRLP
jgi:ketosteroid isomerase-like protein